MFINVLGVVRLNKTESAVFLYGMKDVFFQIIWRLQQLSLCLVELVNLFPYIDIVFIFSHILAIREYWVLTDSTIPLKPVLGDVRIAVLSNISHEQTQ